MGSGNIRGSTLWSVCLSVHYVQWKQILLKHSFNVTKETSGGNWIYIWKQGWMEIDNQGAGWVGWGRWRMTKSKHQGQGHWFNTSISILAEGSPGRSISPGGWQSMRHVLRNWEWSAIQSGDSGWTDLEGVLQNVGSQRWTEDTDWDLVEKGFKGD